MEFSAQQIAELLNGEIIGDPNQTVADMAKIEEGRPNTITFLANPKYEKYIYDTKASIALVNNTFEPQQELPSTLTLIKVENAYQCLTLLLGYYDQVNQKKAGIEQPSFIHEKATLGNDCYVGAFAYIGEGCTIGDNVKIYPHVFIGDHSTIADNTTIYSGVKIYNKCIIGASCTIHSGAIIGSDGFGFAPNSQNGYQKVPQIGNVILEDYVEIGSNTTVDRATMGSTILRKGVKLDNLIQIAHNVEIGQDTVIAAQTGIAGSTKLGRNMMVGGQVAIDGHLTLANEVKIAAQSGIGKSVKKEGEILQGTPAFGNMDFKRSYVLFRNLPSLRAQIQDLQKKINS